MKCFENFAGDKCPPRWLRAWYQVKTQFKVTKDLHAAKQVDPPTALEW